MNFSPKKPFIILPFLSILFTLSHTHPCSDKFHQLIKSKNLSKCQKLPTLGAELAWSDPIVTASNNNRRHGHVVNILVGAAMDEEQGWLAWGVNPGPQPEMVGTRAAIGIKNAPNGSLYCNTYNVTRETRMGCRLRPSELEEVKCTGFEYDVSTQYHVLSATLNLSFSDYNVSRLQVVWQIGSEAEGNEPKQHAATLRNVDSVETLDLLSGKGTDLAYLKIELPQVHGVMNIIGWGTLLPVGVIIARFFRKFPFQSDDWWFYIHVGCQCLGFSIGVVGWGTGMWLAHSSPRYVFLTHHIFAIFIFAFATLQTLAIRFRPSHEDDFRKVWNIYHHFLGYALLAVIFANIFEGIKILKPENKENWRGAVIGILVALGTITLILEAYTWYKFIAERKELEKESLSNPSKQPEEEDEVETRNSLMTTPSLSLVNKNREKVIGGHIQM